MNRNQMENLYKANKIEDYKLQSTEQLLKVHGIDYKKIDGYNRLDDINRVVYEKFIVNFFNVWGLESRTTLVPKGIYYVEETQYLAKENQEDDYYIVVGGIANIIDRNGFKSVLKTWEDKDYKHLKVEETESKTYLRFEYEHEDYKKWLHVIKEEEWY